MKDMISHWYKFRSDAVECATIRDQTIDTVKRELFTRLAGQLNMLAIEVERAMTAKTNGSVGPNQPNRDGRTSAAVGAKPDMPQTAQFSRG